MAPSHLVCVRVGDNPVSTAVVLDNSDAAMGPLSVIFYDEGATWCPSPLGAGDPALTVVGPTTGDAWQLSLANVRGRPSTCGPAPEPAAPFATLTNTALVFDYGELYDGDGSCFHFADASAGNSLVVQNSLISGIAGPAVSGTVDLQLYSSEISSMSPEGEPLLSTGGRPLRIEASGLFGNTVAGGSPLVEAAGTLQVERTLLAGNVAGDGGPLVAAPALPAEEVEWQGLRDSVISRNMLTGSAPTAPSTIIEREVGSPSSTSMCLPFGAAGHWYRHRAPATAPHTPSSAGLVEVRGSTTRADARFLVAGSFLVDNELSSTGVDDDDDDDDDDDNDDDDDDDSGDDDDSSDDNSASGDDDDTRGPGDSTLQDGCQRQGVGASYTCQGGGPGLLPLSLLALRRRRH